MLKYNHKFPIFEKEKNMRKLNYGKKPLFAKSNSISKEAIALFIYLPIAAISLVICAIILLQPEEPIKFVENFETAIQETEKYTYSPTSPSSLEFQSFGDKTCTITGIGSFVGKDLKIPSKSPDGDQVVAINSNAFLGCETLESISIPETVRLIGKDAFKECSSLACINVDINNENYSSVNGVLFSKSKDLLIKYPSNKGSEKYYLDSNVKNIESNAFENVKKLSSLLYAKDSSDFEKIDIGEGNETLDSISISYNSFIIRTAS